MSSFLPTGLTVGIELNVLSVAEGGRERSIGGSDYPPGGYRPNWGLPEMTPPEQTGAPVLCFEHDHVAPGESVRAVIVPMFPDEVSRWRDLAVGDPLLMYEGTRMCGRATVAWVVSTRNTEPPRGTPVGGLRLSEEDLTRFECWARGGSPPKS